MLCNQFRHTTSQDLEVLYTESIFIDILYIHVLKKFIQLPIFFTRDYCSKTRKVVNLFLNIAGAYQKLNAPVLVVKLRRPVVSVLSKTLNNYIK